VIEVALAPSFSRAFRKRIQGQGPAEERFWERLQWFTNDPFDPRLRTHKLSGKLKDAWAFTVERDVRVVFNFEEGGKKAVLFDIGSHDEVY
jgi:mRNA-degrading endonuclease YafQ of YafQ-DinJ toxin-antitoxin module